LVDEFMAKAIAVRTHGAAAEMLDVHEQAVGVDTSLTSSAAYVEVESSARIVTPTTLPISPFRPQTGLVTMPVKSHAETLTPQADEPPHIASRNWRAEAWERERARELRAIERRPDIAARRRSSA
jgi:hypothetical protein